MANKSISQLNAGAAVAAGNLVPVVQTAGIGPVKITASAFGDYFLKGTYTSNTLVYDSANNNIGIGTTTPTNIAGATTLSINATGVNQSGVVVFQNNGSQLARQGILSGFFTIQDLGSANGLVIDEQSALPVIFKTTALERMRITSAGNVCIGAQAVVANEVMRLGYAAQNSILLGNTAQDNAGFVGAFNDFSLFGVNRNPSTGVVVNTNKYTAQIAAFGSTTESYISFSTSTVPNVNPTERMRITSAGNVGIGVAPNAWSAMRAVQNGSVSLATDLAVPRARVMTNTFYDGSVYKFIDASSLYANMYVQNSVDGAHQWFTSTAAGTSGNTATLSELMRITSAGNVGIGVAPSAWGSSYKALQNPAGSFAAFSTSQIWFGQNVYDSGVGAMTYMNNGTATRYLQTSGTHYWYNAPSGTAGSAITFTQAMTLDASGNLAIGDTSATQRLKVVSSAGVDSAAFSDASFYTLAIRANSTNNGVILVGTAGTTCISLGSNNTEWLRLNGTGLMSFQGTTSSFPALKRSSATLQVRLADDTGDAGLQCGTQTAGGTAFNVNGTGGNSIASITNTTTGTLLQVLNSSANTMMAVTDTTTGTLFSVQTAGGASLMTVNDTTTGTLFAVTNNSSVDVFTVSDAGVTTFTDAGNLVFGTTTGSKIGTATSQKIGFWNAAPIVQPTTAVAAATVAATGAGDVVAASTTFDGYTIPQIVKALRNAGLLA